MAGKEGFNFRRNLGNRFSKIGFSEEKEPGSYQQKNHPSNDEWLAEYYLRRIFLAIRQSKSCYKT
jgi:hypothetical protein